MPSDDKKPVTVKTDNAHAGAPGHNVRMVLVACLVGAILLMILIASLTLH